MKRALSAVVLLFLAACSSAAVESAAIDPANPAPGEPDPVATPAKDGGVDSPSDPGSVRFKIQIDYRFDTAGFFADPVRKQALEGACRIWGRLLSDSFANVPAGTFIRVRDPQKPAEPALSLNIEYEIDDLVIFVGSADLASGTTGMSSPTAGLSGITDPQLAQSLQQRFDATPFQPWTAWISFDTTTSFHFDPDPEAGNAVPAGKMDFVSVALHEIGHVLGFGTANAFKLRVLSGAFQGAKAVAENGGPLVLSPDQGHVPNTTTSGGQRLLMDVSDAQGTRYLPTPLDKAVFEDMGFHF